MGVTVFSDERSMPIEKVRKSGIIAFDEVSKISRWLSDEAGFSTVGGELAIDCTKATKRSVYLTGCTFNRWRIKRTHDRNMVRRR